MRQAEFLPNLAARKRKAGNWVKIFRFSTVIGMVVLGLLMLNIINSAFGYVVLQGKINPDDLKINGTALEQMSQEQLAEVFKANVSAGLYRRFESEQPLSDRSASEIRKLIQEWVIKPQVLKVYPLFESILNSREIKAQTLPAGSRIAFMNWLDVQFITSPQEAEALQSGVRTAILGSLWTIAIAILFAFPVGVSACHLPGGIRW